MALGKSLCTDTPLVQGHFHICPGIRVSWTNPWVRRRQLSHCCPLCCWIYKTTAPSNNSYLSLPSVSIFLSGAPAELHQLSVIYKTFFLICYYYYFLITSLVQTSAIDRIVSMERKYPKILTCKLKLFQSINTVSSVILVEWVSSVLPLCYRLAYPINIRWESFVSEHIINLSLWRHVEYMLHMSSHWSLRPQNL